MKKYVLGLAAIGLIVAALTFQACKKDGDSVYEKGVKESHYLIGAVQGADTIYVPTNLEIYCEECNICYDVGGNCLPEVPIYGSISKITIMHDIFAELIAADDKDYPDVAKRNIILNNRSLFVEFIEGMWFEKIENGTGFVSVTNPQEYKYVFSFRFINNAGGTTYLMIGDNRLIFDALYQIVVLKVEDEEIE